MNTPQIIIIPTTTVTKDFKSHIESENNIRILFSGPFGAGKTSFLKDFFHVTDGYKVVTLNPVDYAVANNVDIMELIKHDILMEMLDKYEEEINLVVSDFKQMLTLQTFAKDKLDLVPLVKTFASILYDDANAAIEAIMDVGKQFRKYEKDVRTDESLQVLEYLAQQRFTKGSIRETDEITAMIKDFATRIKRNVEDEKLVLIIDDLDRLDPENVFRIFNVFTAHHDSRTEINKFGFDKVIFVCDIENIRHMFHHRFGAEVDFTGYIDKFYSLEIFKFDIKKHLNNLAHNLLKSKEFLGANHSEGYPDYLDKAYSIVNRHTLFFDALKYVVSALIDNDLIKIRNFDRFRSYSLPNYSFVIGHGRERNAYDYPLLVMLFILSQFYPTYIDLLKTLKKLSDVFVSDYRNGIDSSDDYQYRSYLIEASSRFLMHDKDFAPNHHQAWDITFSMKNEFSEIVDVVLNFDYNHTPKLVGVFLGEIDKIHPNQSSKPNPYWFMYCAMNKLIKDRILR
jgi:hypothetical protein